MAIVDHVDGVRPVHLDGDRPGDAEQLRVGTGVDHPADRIVDGGARTEDLERGRRGGIAALDGSVRLDDTVASICHDWIALAPAARHLVLDLQAGHSLVAFDTGHLRQLLHNLLNNAQRYRSERSDALRISTSNSFTGTATLTVWSDGAPIEPTIEKHLFEPFFSSESRSSGLGLYICRELCTRHGAMIRYERQSARRPQLADGNAFIVQFRRAASSAATPTQENLLPT